MRSSGDTAFLLDGNVLIALSTDDHIHFAAARRWLQHMSDAFVTTPITQGTLLRFLIRQGAPSDRAMDVLVALTSDPRHTFWPDSVPYDQAVLARIRGHGDVTDAYLARLARVHEGRLATFDRRLADLHPDVVEVIDTQPGR